jgi:hypothetical protein
MNLRFELKTLGWMAAEFITDDETITVYHSSDYGDIFQKLLNGLFLIKDSFSHSMELLWEDDNVNYLWILNVKSDINIQIYEVSPDNSNYKQEILNYVMPLEALFNDIYISLDEMYKKFGLIGYKKTWEAGNFPIFEYLTLKAEKEGLRLDAIHHPDDDEGWTNKVNTKDELKFLAPVF